jgi:hypothetical protein
MARTRAYAVGLLVGVLAVAAGVAYAASGSSGAITVCVHRADGVLYKARVCDAGDSRITWNVRGPAGPRGAKGRRGSVGATGATGASGTNGTNGAPGANGAGALVDYSSQLARGIGLGFPLTNFLTENLPAGSFVALAKLVYQFDSDGPSTSDGFASGSCTLSDGENVDTASASQYVEGSTGGQGSEEGAATMQMQLPLTETTGTTVSVSCTEPTGATTMAVVSYADLDAIQVSQMISKPIAP